MRTSQRAEKNMFSNTGIIGKVSRIGSKQQNNSALNQQNNIVAQGKTILHNARIKTQCLNSPKTNSPVANLGVAS